MKKYELLSKTYRIPSHVTEKELLRLTEEFRSNVDGDGKQVLKGPFTDVQTNLFDVDAVDVCVRAIVVPKPRARRRNSSGKTGSV